jgi:hypothetical protein
MTPALSSLAQLWQHDIAPALANKTVLVVTMLGSLANFITTDLLTDNKPLAVAISAASMMGIAYLTTRPRLVAAMAAREATRHVNQEHTQAALIENLHYEIERRTSEIGLIRISKHNALNALQAAYWHIDELHEICRYSKPQIKLPEFTKMSVKEIFGEEDEQLKNMIADLMRRRALKDEGQEP